MQMLYVFFANHAFHHIKLHLNFTI